MIVEFPDFTRFNPWQIKMISTEAPMKVTRTNDIQNCDCFAYLISWEDYLLKQCKNGKDADKKIDEIEKFLHTQKKKSKIIWIVHNLESHFLKSPEHEKRIRSLLSYYASLIVVMSESHKVILDPKYFSKTVVVPHYIEQNSFSILKKFDQPTLFKYGLPRKETNSKILIDIIADNNIKKFISDSRVNGELDNEHGIIVKRRFTSFEADLYAQLSNFALFYRQPQFNSGVLNFYIGSKLIIFHTADSVKYMELPQCYKFFQVDPEVLTLSNFELYKSHIIAHMSEIDYFIHSRSATKVSHLFWRNILEN